MKNDLRQTKLYLFLEAVDSLDDIFLLLRKTTYLLLLALFIKSLYTFEANSLTNLQKNKTFSKLFSSLSPSLDVISIT